MVHNSNSPFRWFFSRSAVYLVMGSLIAVSSLYLASFAGPELQQIGISTEVVSTAMAQEGAASQPLPEVTPIPGGAYEKLNPRAGVWNDGQAALWDLPIIDYYTIFGAPERARGYQPTQPINFSHVLHVQNNQMECQYCHWTVNKSHYAAIPEVETCMGCHKLIPGRIPAGGSENPEIKKLKEFADKGVSIPWEKVHVMPDHVRFNHKRHVKAGVACHECHGQVPAMPVVERVTSMKMGWCIDCHRAKGTSIDCATCHK